MITIITTIDKEGLMGVHKSEFWKTPEKTPWKYPFEIIETVIKEKKEKTGNGIKNSVIVIGWNTYLSWDKCLEGKFSNYIKDNFKICIPMVFDENYTKPGSFCTCNTNFWSAINSISSDIEKGWNIKLIALNRMCDWEKINDFNIDTLIKTKCEDMLNLEPTQYDIFLLGGQKLIKKCLMNYEKGAKRLDEIIFVEVNDGKDYQKKYEYSHWLMMDFPKFKQIKNSKVNYVINNIKYELQN